MPSFREKLTSWEVLSSNLGANLNHFPGLETRHEAFAGIIAEGLSLVAQQDASEAQFRSLIERRNDLERRGNHAREYLVAALREALGVSNPLLLGYDIRPRVSRRRPLPEPTAPPLEKPPSAAAETAPPPFPLDPDIH